MTASPILIPAIGAERASWLGLADISEIMSQGWSLAGGSMMRLLAAERSYAGSRSTHDIDVILDIRASRAYVRQFHEALSNAGFSIAGFNASGQNHRWIRGEAQIDILIPSGQSESARTYEYPGFGRLLETRGAQFGLERTRKASVLCANRQFTVNVPVWAPCTRKYRLCSTMEIPIKVDISETLFFYLQFLILKSVEISRRFLENRYIAFMTVFRGRSRNTPALFLTASWR